MLFFAFFVCWPCKLSVTKPCYELWHLENHNRHKVDSYSIICQPEISSIAILFITIKSCFKVKNYAIVSKIMYLPSLDHCQLSWGVLPKKLWWGSVCGPLPKTLTPSMTKICYFPYPIYDMAKNLIPYLWPFVIYT